MLPILQVLLACASVEWLLLLVAATLILVYDVEHHLSQDASVVYASLSIFVVVAHCGFTVDALLCKHSIGGVDFRTPPQLLCFVAAENSFQFLASQLVGALETLMILYFVFFHPSTLGAEWYGSVHAGPWRCYLHARAAS